jgi:DNA-binding NtrC family response regulator
VRVVSSPVLLVCSENPDRRLIETVLRHWDIDVVSCDSLCDAQAALKRRNVRLIFCDEKLKDGGYRDLLALIRGKRKKPRAVVMAAGVEPEREHLEALESGAFDVISKPCARNDVQWMIIHALREDSHRVPWESLAASRERRTARRTSKLQ